MRPVAPPTCSDLPVSSSMWARSISTRNVSPSTLDVGPAVEGDRLVVLRGLEVLRHVRVEVVLPREPAPLGDLAVQRQADPDRRLDGLAVDHRQRRRAGRGRSGRSGCSARRRRSPGSRRTSWWWCSARRAPRAPAPGRTTRARRRRRAARAVVIGPPPCPASRDRAAGRPTAARSSVSSAAPTR